MKKILFFLVLSLLFFACDDITDDIVEAVSPSYQVISLDAPDELQYTDTEVELNVSVEFEDISTISSVWFDVVDEDGSSEIKSNVELSNTEGSNIYSGQTVLDSATAEGKYYVEIYVEDNQRNSEENVQQVVSHAFEFYSMVGNYSPEISNISMIDEVALGEVFAFSIDVKDDNGLSDIDSVYYEVFDPQGNQLTNSDNISKFPLSDNGDTDISGDVTANDGTYTMLLAIPGGYLAGNWIFKFKAIDSKGAASNEVTHIMNVTNSSPTISNLVIADSVSREEEFFFSVKASDSNGLSDVDSVYYKLFTPDGEMITNNGNISKFILFDDGDTDDTGDERENDGIYTTKSKIPETYPGGDWKLEFTAVDYNGAESNKIIHTLTVR